MRTELIARCRRRAKRCRVNADERIGDDAAAAWLDLADDWTRLADALEKEDDPKWLH
jgi:hypothetical protein